MSSSKRRKLDVGQETPMLSAAALRRRLLEQKATGAASPGASPSNNSGTNTPEALEQTPASSISKCKQTSKSPVKKEFSRTPELVLLGDSGTVDAHDLETTEPVDEELPKRKIIQLSSINPTKGNLSQREPNGTVVLRFPDNSERLVMLGSYGVRVKSGEASIYGSFLRPSDKIHWVHAPHCHALPVLRCAEKSVVELHPHPGAAGLRSLERLSSVFGSIWNDDAPKNKQTWQFLATSADGPKKAMLQDLKSPAEWNKKMADLVTKNERAQVAPIFMVCGPKSSGKSTFTRIVANRLVTHQSGSNKLPKWPAVAVLDIDPGQPEFSPPGTISLVKLDEPNLSPPFAHPTLGSESIIRAHAVASITPASDIEQYKRCVLDLFKHYRLSCVGCPLIVNTPGWIQGSGLVMLQDLVEGIHPTEILYMSEDGPEDTVEGLRSAGRNTPLTCLPSQSSEYTSRTAQHLRQMQTMSYFHIDPEKSLGTALRWDPSPLTASPPWLLSYSGATSSLLGVVCYGYQPAPDLLAETIDGTILAIVEIQDPTTAFSLSGQRTLADITHLTPAEQIPYIRDCEPPLNPAASRCLGLALVRGIDVRAKCLALSTPLLLPSGGSSRNIVLVSGKFEPPTWAYTEDHYHRVYTKENNDDATAVEAFAEIPWTEKLHGSEKRAVGSKVWRVRRDLGRNNSAGGGE